VFIDTPAFRYILMLLLSESDVVSRIIHWDPVGLYVAPFGDPVQPIFIILDVMSFLKFTMHGTSILGLKLLVP